MQSFHATLAQHYCVNHDTQDPSASTSAYEFVETFVFVCGCVFVCEWLHVFMRACVCVRVRMHVRVCVCVCVCVCVSVHVPVYVMKQ